MKTRFSYAVSALLSFLLCAAMLCGTVLPAMAEETELPSLDYYNPNIENTASLSGYDLYTALLDSTPTAGETLYWQQSDLSLKYTDFIPDSCIDTLYDGDRGVLDITIFPYTYHAANGADVTWTPTKLFLEGQAYDLVCNDGVYTAHVENCFYSGDFDMNVDYIWQVEIPQEIVYALRHEAYQKGYDALSLMVDYRKELAYYEALVKLQNDWDNYEKQKEAYANYLVEKALYDELKKEYDAYMVEYNAYKAVLDVYNEWQKYFKDYEEFPAKQQAYADYMNYYKVYKAALDKLAMFESIFQRESRGWSMYADIMGNAVTEVLSKQDLLVTSGCNPNDIYLAGSATENLRVLLKGYADLRDAQWKSNHQKYEALYNYYTRNYDALRQNFCDLYRTLKGLYENTVVSNFIGLKGKTEHYRQLVGHLFVISTSLDQSSERNDAVWRIDGMPLRDVIEDVHYFEDGDWDPKHTPYPTVEIPYAESPAIPQEPTVDCPPEPTAPPEVKNPGDPPAVVEVPISPEEAPKPIGEKPQRPVFDEAVELLWQEVENGQLKKYTSYVYPEILTVTNTIKRSISIKNFKTVTLYHPDGSVYQKIPVDYGQTITPDPYPFEDSPAYFYEWIIWGQLMPNGDVLYAKDFLITENTSLYPRYNAIAKVYYITWVVDGESYTEPYYYGVTPDPKPFIGKYPYEEQYYRYEFSGWDSEIGPVTGNKTYTGHGKAIPKEFKVTWVIKNGAERIPDLWEYDSLPVFSGDITYTDEYYVYSLDGWDKPVSRVTRAAIYTAHYKKEPLAAGGLNVAMQVIQGENDVTVLATKSSIKPNLAAAMAYEAGKTLTIFWEGKLTISFSGQELKNYIDCGCPTLNLYSEQTASSYVYRFEFSNISGNASVLPQMNIQFEYSKENDRETVFDVQTENGWERLADATYATNGAFVVRSKYAYSIVPTVNKFCNVSQMDKKAVPGDWVSLDLNCVYGYKIVGATVTDADGNVIALEGLSFQMPSSAVNVVLEVERIVYRVTFMVDGEVWHSAEYFAGDEIVLPEAPPKRIEGEHAYTFIGWGNVPAIATGEEEELVFEASFTQSTIVDDYDTGNNNDVVFTIVLPIVGAVLVLLIAFLILRRIVRKKGGWKLFGVKIRLGLKRFCFKITSVTKRLFLKIKMLKTGSSHKNQK